MQEFNWYEKKNSVKKEVSVEDWHTILWEELQNKLDEFEIDWEVKSSDCCSKDSLSDIKNVIEKLVFTLFI